jgi:hypothetical protein
MFFSDQLKNNVRFSYQKKYLCKKFENGIFVWIFLLIEQHRLFSQDINTKRRVFVTV